MAEIGNVSEPPRVWYQSLTNEKFTVGLAKVLRNKKNKKHDKFFIIKIESALYNERKINF